MTYQTDCTLPKELLEQIVAQGLDAVPEMIRTIINTAMQLERQERLGAGPYERTLKRRGYAGNTFLTASIKEGLANRFVISIAQQSEMPYAIFECKRVGVEEGAKKGPQTIEKAKQGAYVAK